MAKVTWLGEGDDGPKENTWGGHTFKVGEAVEVDDPFIVGKAKINKFYKVEGSVTQKPDVKAPPQSLSTDAPKPSDPNLGLEPGTGQVIKKPVPKV